MALPTNTYRPKRYLRSKFREGKFLLAAEATDIQLESFELLRDFIQNTYGDIAVGPAFRADQISTTLLRLRPGEAWDKGIPYLLESGSDANVIAGVLPAGVTLADASRTTSDAGGKNLDLSGGLANGSYAIILEASEELVRPSGTGAVDSFLEGVNVGEDTQHKLRMVYKVHVVDQSDLNQSPTYPLSGLGITNHFVNEILITPTATENFLTAAVDITPDVNGADRRITFNNSADNIPFSTDANDFIFGQLEDSDGNRFTITSITTTDGGATVQMLIDRAVDVGSANPKAGLPVITQDVPFKLIKRDHYVTTTTGDPQGKHYLRTADFDFAAGSLTTLTDLRTISDINTFGVDPNVRLAGGGIIAWDTGTTLLTHDADFVITIPGLVGRARITTPPGSIALPNDGDVAYVLLDREATGDYNLTATVVDKDDVPRNVNVYILAERFSDRIYFPHNGSIGDGETGVLGAFGATLDKDLSEDLIIDALSENQMDEVFAETFNTQDAVDTTNAMTFEVFQKQFRASSTARFVDYEADVVPASASPNPWTKLGTQLESVLSGVLTLTDASIGDRIAYTRAEASLTQQSHNDNEFRCRMPVTGGTPPNFQYEMRDGNKHIVLALTPTGLELRDGPSTVLQSFALDTTTFHEYRIVKIGDLAVQVYTDGVLRLVEKYSNFVASGVGFNDVTWGTTTTATATLDVDFVRFNIYGSILQSTDVFNRGSVFFDGDVLPESDPTSPWTKNGGGGGISTTIDSDNRLVISDPSAADDVNYDRDETVLRRKGDAEIEMRVKIDSGHVNFEQFGIRLQDGTKDVAAYIKDTAGQLKVGMYDGGTGALISTEHNIPVDEFVVIRLKKLKDTGYQLFIDGKIEDSNAYEEFPSATSFKKFQFGGFNTPPTYTATVDYVQYQLPGQGDMASTPVRDLLTIVNGDDPFPQSWVSTDGLTWFEMEPGKKTSVPDLQQVGGNLIVRVMLSLANSVLTDYGVLYNLTGFEVEGQFNYDQQTAAGGETIFTLPFNYNPGVNELVVYHRPVGTNNGHKLVVGADYNEVNATQIELIGPLVAAAGDIFEFKNTFVKDPLVPPPVRFLAHDHSGGSGESDILRPNSIAVSDEVIANLNIDALPIAFEFEGPNRGAATQQEAFSKMVNQGAIMNALNHVSLDFEPTDLDSVNPKFGKYAFSLDGTATFAYPAHGVNKYGGSFTTHFRNLAQGDYIGYNPQLGIELYLDSSGFLTIRVTERTAASETTKETKVVAGSVDRSGDASYHNAIATWALNELDGAGQDSLQLRFDGNFEGSQLSLQDIDINAGDGGFWIFGAIPNDPAWDHIYTADTLPDDGGRTDPWTKSGTAVAAVSNGVITFTGDAVNTALYENASTGMDLSQLSATWKCRLTDSAGQRTAIVGQDSMVIFFADNTLQRTIAVQYYKNHLSVQFGNGSTIEAPMEITLDTSQWHTYWLTSEGSPDPQVTLWIDGVACCEIMNDVVNDVASINGVQFGGNNLPLFDQEWEYIKTFDSGAVNQPYTPSSQGELDSIGITNIPLSLEAITFVQTNKISSIFGGLPYQGPWVPWELQACKNDDTTTNSLTWSTMEGFEYFIVGDGVTEWEFLFNPSISVDNTSMTVWTGVDINGDHINSTSLGGPFHAGGGRMTITNHNGQDFMVPARRSIVLEPGLHLVRAAWHNDDVGNAARKAGPNETTFSVSIRKEKKLG